MSKKKSANMPPSGKGLLRIFNMLNIALPKELQLQKLYDLPSMNDLKSRFNELDAQLTKLRAAIRLPHQPTAFPDVNVTLLAELATNAWKAKKKVVDSDGEVLSDMRRVNRHIDAVLETLNHLGVDIKDHTGRKYDSGMAVTVISFEPTPGLLKEEIKETLKPSVFWHNHPIQKSEVIVGTPQK